MENNFGLIEINWETPISLTFKIIDIQNKIRAEKKVLLSELSKKHKKNWKPNN